MRHKYLLSLVALISLGAFSCTDTDGSCANKTHQCNGNILQLCDNGTWISIKDCGKTSCNAQTGACNTSPETPETCTNKAQQCNGNILQLCDNGTWISIKDCGEAGCNIQTNTCHTPSENPETCTQGEKRCDGTVLQMCVNNAWVSGPDCASTGYTCNAGQCVSNSNPGNNNGGNTGNGDTTVGAACDPTTYAGACSNDGSKRYYCDNTSSVIVEKDCNAGTVCEVKGVNITKCVADPNCNKTEETESSCSDGTDNDCDGDIDSNDHDCTNDSNGVFLSYKLNTSCEPSTYQAGCGADGSRGHYCGKSSKVITGMNCYPGTVCQVQGANYVRCVVDPSCIKTEEAETNCTDDMDNDCDGLIDSLDFDCTSDADNENTKLGAPCDPATYPGFCSTDGTKRYFCNTETGVITGSVCYDGKVCEVQGTNMTGCIVDPNCDKRDSHEITCYNGLDDDCDGFIDDTDYTCWPTYI